tara:strand:- start:3161 stop:3355 length:195 start_codon:yes stop_codon:yes gene_type:complete
MEDFDLKKYLAENKLVNESLEFTPEERKKLIYILGMELEQMEDQGDEFFAEEIEIVTSILNKIK